MKLTEAMSIIRQDSKKVEATQILLISSLETNFLEIYIKAYSIDNGVNAEIQNTDFGNLNLTLTNYANADNITFKSVVIVVDWADIYPSWSLRASNKSYLCDDKHSQIGQFLYALKSLIDKNKTTRFILIPPSTYIPPISYMPDYIFNDVDLLKGSFLLDLYNMTNKHSNLYLINNDKSLGSLPQNQWSDIPSFLRGGWPYSQEATSLLSHAVIKCQEIKMRKKLLITDLDNTLWSGIIGEIGTENVSWEPSDLTYKHLIYQRTLNQLISEGILIAVCSKNELETAMMGLARNDLVLDSSKIVAVKASWQTKSEMIRELLSELNLLPESLVFVDDNPFEIEQVKAIWPDIETYLFPKQNRDIPAFLEKLRSYFTTDELTQDEDIRLQSYIARNAFEKEIKECKDATEYLKSLDMIASVEVVKNPELLRPLELINKTNQFNLNGLRETRESWSRFFTSGYWIFKVSLRDRLSDHGVVLVSVVHESGNTLKLIHLVMSCRVFSRDLERGFIHYLLSFYKNPDDLKVLFQYKKTKKNKPLQTFIENISEKEDATDCYKLKKSFLLDKSEYPVFHGPINK